MAEGGDVARTKGRFQICLVRGNTNSFIPIALASSQETCFGGLTCCLSICAQPQTTARVDRSHCNLLIKLPWNVSYNAKGLVTA